MNPELAPLKRLAERAAREAGQKLRERNSELTGVTSGKHHDLKLSADRQAEEIILAMLSGDSKYPVLSEEAGEKGKPDPNGFRWIVDPLDGTVNYRYGLPLSCVSIALWQNATPRCGVVYDFWRDELFSAIPASGALLNEQAIHVTAATRRDEAVIATGFPVNRDFESVSLRRFISTVQQFRKVRLLGSAALSLAYVASGRADAYYEEDIMLWDVAAGVALVNAAGGCTSVIMSALIPHACTVFAAGRQELMHLG
jgi:myo-inositol-1(or 4)-monophosphatase